MCVGVCDAWERRIGGEENSEEHDVFDEEEGDGEGENAGDL